MRESGTLREGAYYHISFATVVNVVTTEGDGDRYRSFDGYSKIMRRELESGCPSEWFRKSCWTRNLGVLVIGETYGPKISAGKAGPDVGGDHG
jgi:hypothetical protein